MSVGSLSSTHLLVLCVSTDIISLSRFESTGISNGEVVSDGSLSVRILLDGISVDMVMVKRERLVGNCHLQRCFFPRNRSNPVLDGRWSKSKSTVTRDSQ